MAAVNAGKKSIFQFPHLILGAFCIFFHVGAQVIAIDTVIGYAGSMGISLVEARALPSFTLTLTIIGYLIGIVCIPRYIQQVNAFRICTLLGLTFSFLILFAGGTVTFLGYTADVSLWFVVALGLAHSLIWAGIWPLALDGLGRFTKLGASIMIMGLCGNALMPLVYGYLADHLDLRQAYRVLIPCYVYMVFYALYGHKIRRWNFVKSSPTNQPV